MRYIFALLTVLTLIVGLCWVQNLDRSNGVWSTGAMLRMNRGRLAKASDLLGNYKRTHSRYPTNDEGLQPISSQIEDGGLYGSGFRSQSPEFGIVVSRWGEPLVYENRKGLDPRKFADSGATLDTRRLWSVQVDKDVFVWSLAAMQKQAYYDNWQKRLGLLRLAVLVLTCIFFVFFVLTTLRAARPGAAWAKALDVAWAMFKAGALAWAVGLFILPTMIRTCYDMSFSRRLTPELADEYASLIAKYRQRGVISDKAYGTLLNNLESLPGG